MTKSITILLISLWLAFSYIYLFPMPSDNVAHINTAIQDKGLQDYLVYSAYASEATSLTLVVFGLLALYYANKINNMLLFLLSAMIGFSYTLYNSRMRLSTELLDAAHKHGVSSALDFLSTAYRLKADFIYQEILVLLFAFSVILILYKYITTRSSRDLANRSAT